MSIFQIFKIESQKKMQFSNYSILLLNSELYFQLPYLLWFHEDYLDINFVVLKHIFVKIQILYHCILLGSLAFLSLAFIELTFLNSLLIIYLFLS